MTSNRLERDTGEEIEQRLCGEFWVWLYDERKRRGQEPSDAEKIAHPSSVALKAHRASNEEARNG